MKNSDRRRSSPYRGDRRPGGSFRDYNRHRSISPPPRDGRDRYKRPTEPYRRPRRDDYMDDRRDRDYRGRYRDNDRDRYKERLESPPSIDSNKDEGQKGPMTFREFMIKKIDDNIDPKMAEERYNEYLLEHLGSEDKLEFENKKNDQDIRDMFDPRKIEERLQLRKERAQHSAQEFARDYQDGVFNKSASDFKQCLGSEAPKFQYDINTLVKKFKTQYLKEKNKLVVENGAEEGIEIVEESKDGKSKEIKDSSKAEIKQKPKEISKEQVDINSIEIMTSNGQGWVPILFYLPEIQKNDYQIVKELINKVDNEKDIKVDIFKIRTQDDILEANGSSGRKMDEDNKENGSEIKEEDKDSEEKKIGENEDAGDIGENLDIQQLDIMLQYLWKTHGIDYYGGYELAEQDFQIRNEKLRTIRLPLPDVVDEDLYQMYRDNKDLISQYEEKIMYFKHRIENLDPAFELVQKDRLDQELEAFIDKNCIQIEDNKWGCKLSDKKFVAKSYVVKHIKNKHAEKYNEQKDKILDQIYQENYLKAKGEARKQQKEQQEIQQKWVDQQEYEEPENEEEATRMHNMNNRRQRYQGGRMPYQNYMSQPPFMGGAMAAMPFQNMMFPGANPFGGYFMPYPGMPNPYDMQIQMMGHMGRGGRGRDMYGAGRGRMRYHDYDDPQNNRQIIDYDDL